MFVTASHTNEGFDGASVANKLFVLAMNVII